MANDTANVCLTTKLRVKESQQYVESITAICMNANATSVWSKNCKSNNCQSDTTEKKMEAILLNEDLSRMPPGVDLCRKLNGTFQFYDFFYKNKWHSMERCLFSDKSFIDSGALYSKYLELNE